MTGVGQWSFAPGGTGDGLGVISDVNSRTSVFTGTAGQSYTLRWTITNGVCPASSSDVTINLQQSPTVSDAGLDQENCNSGVFTLSGNSPVIGTGVWSIVSGVATISAPTLFNSGVTNVPAGSSVILRWTISNGVCPTSSDDVQLTNDNLPTGSLSGTTSICNGGSALLTFTLTGIGPFDVDYTDGITTTTLSNVSNGATISVSPSSTKTYSITRVNDLGTDGSCLATSFGSSAVVTVNQLPVGNSIAAGTYIVCSGTSLNITPTTNVVGSTFTWTGNNGSGGSGAITDTPVNTTASSIDITYTVTPTGPGVTFCIGTPFTIIVTVNPIPVITNPTLTTTMCSGAGALSFTPTINVPGSTYSWTSTILSGTFSSGVTPGPVSSSPITDNPINSGNTIGVIQYRITPTGPSPNFCVGNFVDYIVTVNPSPSFTITNNTTSICSGTATDITLSTPTANGTITLNSVNYAGALGGTQVGGNSYIDGQKILETLTNHGNVPITISYTFSISANGCNNPTSQTTNVILDPIPVITNTTLTTTMCSGAGALSFTPAINVVGSSYTWTSTILSGTFGSGVTSGPVSNSPITDNPVNSGNTIGVIQYRITPTGPASSSCTGNFVDYVVTVNPSPTFAIINNSTSICSGAQTDITLATPTINGILTLTSVSYGAALGGAQVNGNTYSAGQKIVETLINPGNTPITVSYTFSVAANGCSNPTTQTTTVILNPAPVITNSATQLLTTICSGVALNFIPTSSVPGTTYTWTTAASSVSIQNYTVTPPIGTGAIIDSPTNSSNVPGTVTYTITPSAGGCVGLPKDYVVTVNPVPTASGSNATICTGETTNIAINAGPNNVAGTTFSWTVIPTPNVVGAFADNGSTIIQTLSLSNSSVGTVTYRITPTANNCSNLLTTDIVVTVNPVATVDAGVDFAVCEPSTISLVGSIGGAAATATWSIVTGSGSISSTTVSGTSVTATYTVGVSDVATTVTFKLTTNDPDGPGPCSLATDLINVAVNRAALITTFPSDINVCEPSTVPLTATIGGGATKGTWNIYNGSGQGNLLATNVSGTTVSSTYQVATSDVTNIVTFQLLTDDPDGSGPCPVVSQNYNVTIDRAARAIAPATLAICSDSPSINLSGSVGGSATTSLWTGGAGSYDNTSNPSATYTISSGETPPVGGTPINVTLTLTAYPSGSPSCSSVSTQTILTINPLPSVGFTISGVSGVNNNIANNDPPATLNGFQSGGVFTSVPTSAPINLVTHTPFDVASFDPSIAPTYPPTRNQVTYTYTDPKNCTNSVTQQITVTPVATITFYLRKPDNTFLSQNTTKNFGEYNYEVCSEVGLITLDGQPFNPADPYTRFDIQPSNGIPIPNLAQHLNFAGGKWTLDTNGLPSGSYDITYYYRDANGTPPPKIRTLDVYAAPIAQVSLSSTCVVNSLKLNDATQPITDQFGSQINSWAWVVKSNGALIYRYNQFDSVKFSLDEPGVKDITLTVGTNQACFSKKDTSITVGDYPIPDFDWSNICTFDLTNFKSTTTFGSGIGGIIIKYDWDFNDTSPTHTVTLDTAVHKYNLNGTYNVKMTVTTDVGCIVSKVKPVDILVTTNSGSQTPPPTLLNPYQKDFNSTDEGWIPQAFNATNSTSSNIIQSQSSWVWGLPSGNTFQPYQGSKAWWTGANNETYFNYESSAINGPCFDLTQLTRPMVSMDYWIDANENYDGAVLQYSVDGGLSWEIVGPLAGTPVIQRNQGINWYNPGATIVGNPGNQLSGPYGWTGKNTNWLNARFNLDILPKDSITINGSLQAKRKQVRMRISFASGVLAAGNVSYGGFAFDNFFVGEKTRTVLIEHFTNATDQASVNGDQFFIARETDQENLHAGITDFTNIQYHTRFPKPDSLDVPASSEFSARALFYQTQKIPYSVIDGNSDIQAKSVFGDYNELSTIEIDRRSLADPEVLISSLQDKSTANDSLNVSFDIDVKDTINYPIIANVALIENTVDVMGGGSSIAGTYRNVVRKFAFGSEGLILNKQLLPNDKLTLSAKAVALNTVIKNSNNLSLVAFVQNFYTKEILQSAVTPISGKNGISLITAVENSNLSADDIMIYPNPASGSFNFALPGDFPSGCIWKLSDQRGITVMSGDFLDAANGRKEVRISGLTNGLYIVAIAAPGQNPVYKKILVMNAD